MALQQCRSASQRNEWNQKSCFPKVLVAIEPRGEIRKYLNHKPKVFKCGRFSRSSRWFINYYSLCLCLWVFPQEKEFILFWYHIECTLKRLSPSHLTSQANRFLPKRESLLLVSCISIWRYSLHTLFFFTNNNIPYINFCSLFFSHTRTWCTGLHTKIYIQICIIYLCDCIDFHHINIL